MSERPTVSVILPVYNAENTLPDALDALLGQKGVSLEVLAVNDASTDGSRAILSAAAARDDRLKVLDTPENLGAGAARNLALAYACGEYLYYADADDQLYPGSLRALVTAADGADVTVCGYRHERCAGNAEIGSTESPGGPALFEGDGTRGDLICELDRRRCFAYVWNKLYRREAVQGIRFGTTRISEDLTYNCRVFCAVGSVRLFPGALYLYRTGGSDSLTGRVAADGMALTDLRFREMYDAVSRFGPPTEEQRASLANIHIRHVFFALARRTAVQRVRDPAALRREAEKALLTPAGRFSALYARPDTPADAVCISVFRTGSPRLICLAADTIARLRL
ncbi:MAG: glycosyltransferase family 2 protein [Clostridia bacterium]|nr:glycosyltransferase family 2 protein [Clostridia bacterium]